MNFNLINKKRIDKEYFNICLSRNQDEEVVKYFYKIATIIANYYQIRDYELRQDMIQDAVYVAYKRKNGFRFDLNYSAYSYFYKLILNHFKDIMRKRNRRTNIANIVSYDKTEDNISKYKVFNKNISFDFYNNISNGQQTYFIKDIKDIIYYNRPKKKKVKKTIDYSYKYIQHSFINFA